MGSYWLGQEHEGGEGVNPTLFRGIDGSALLVAEQLQSLAKKGEKGANWPSTFCPLSRGSSRRVYIGKLARYDSAQLPPGTINSECWLMVKTILVFLFSMLSALPSLAFAAAATVRVNIGAASVSSSALSLWAAQERVVAALTESLAFVQAPANKPIVLRILMKQLRINDSAAADEGYQDHLLTLNRKPYPSLDGLRNAQRLMAQQNPKVAALKVEDLVDSRFVRKLDESGSIDRLYGAQR